MKRILVTGAAGFVGSEVVRFLLERGEQVTALDRVCPRLETEFIHADLTDPTSLNPLKGREFDCVMHLASLPGDTGNPEEMVRVNVNGCLNLLEVARQGSVRRILLVSSISAYEWYPSTRLNPPDYLPVDEKHPCRPRDMYSTTKRIQELLVMTYFHQYELPVTILRLTAVIGPQGAGGGRGWRTFAERLAGGKKVQVPHFSANEVCHYVDIRDVARMVMAAAESPAAVGEIFNCCGPTPTSGADFQDVVESLVPGIQVEFGFPWSMAQGGVIYFDRTKAKKLLQFEPIYTLKDSIQTIQDWINRGGLLEGQPSADTRYGVGIARTD